MYFWTFQLKQNSDWVEVWGRWTNRLMLRSSGLQGKRCNTTSEYITITVLLYIHVYVAFDKNNFLIYLFLYILLKRCIYNWIIGIDVLFMICFIFLAPIAYYFLDFRTWYLFACTFYWTVVIVWKIDVFIYDIYRITCHKCIF